MATVDEVVDQYSGMISREQAEALIGSKGGGAPGGRVPGSDVTSVAELLQFIRMRRNLREQKHRRGSGDVPQVPNKYIVDIDDFVYRVFNPVSLAIGKFPRAKRVIVLGKEGATVKLTVYNKLSDSVDAGEVERGDKALVSGAVLNMKSEELEGSAATAILRISQAPDSTTRFSELVDGAKNIDVIGRVEEVGAVRHVGRIGGAGEVGVADCVLVDRGIAMNVSFWGSSALCTSRMKAGDTVKIEFCAARTRGDAIEIQANDLSRVLVIKRA